MEFSKRLGSAIDRLWDLAANEHGAAAAVDELIDAITEELRSAVPRWRSMESAPTDGWPALFCWPDGTRMIGWQYADGSIAGQHGGYLPRGAIAWMPLPDPPTGEVSNG